MKKGILLSFIAAVLLSTFVFAEVAPAPVKAEGKPPVKKLMKIMRVKKMKITKAGTMEPTGKKGPKAGITLPSIKEKKK